MIRMRTKIILSIIKDLVEIFIYMNKWFIKSLLAMMPFMFWALFLIVTDHLESVLIFDNLINFFSWILFISGCLRILELKFKLYKDLGVFR